MSNHTNTLARQAELACEIIDSLIEYNDKRLESTAESLGEKFSLSKFFKSIYYTWKISKFEVEVLELQEHLSTTKDFYALHDLVCEFNDFLASNKSMLIGYIEVTNLYPNEDAETIYNALTFGGSV
jgi:hypothetical protein